MKKKNKRSENAKQIKDYARQISIHRDPSNQLQRQTDMIDNDVKLLIQIQINHNNK